jgi:hypothetical protein
VDVIVQRFNALDPYRRRGHDPNSSA